MVFIAHKLLGRNRVGVEMRSQYTFTITFIVTSLKLLLNLLVYSKSTFIVLFYHKQKTKFSFTHMQMCVCSVLHTCMSVSDLYASNRGVCVF